MNKQELDITFEGNLQLIRNRDSRFFVEGWKKNLSYCCGDDWSIFVDPKDYIKGKYHPLEYLIIRKFFDDNYIVVVAFEDNDRKLIKTDIKNINMKDSDDKRYIEHNLCYTALVKKIPEAELKTLTKI
jgi:hypothetical protein